MKSTIAVFASLALAAFVAGQSTAQAGQTSDQSVRTADGSMARIAAFIPAPAYSTPRTAPVLVDCKAQGEACEDNMNCCSTVCNPPAPGTPKGTDATCE